MPMYDYKCKKCGHEFEEMLPISRRDEPTKTPCSIRILDANQDPQCFDCNGEVKMRISAPGFVYDNISGTTAKGHRKKPDEAFTDHLKQMKRNYPGSKMNV